MNLYQHKESYQINFNYKWEVCPPKKGISGVKSPRQKPVKVFPFISRDEQVSIEETTTTQYKGSLETIAYTSEILGFWDV